MALPALRPALDYCSKCSLDERRAAGGVALAERLLHLFGDKKGVLLYFFPIAFITISCPRLWSDITS